MAKTVAEKVKILSELAEPRQREQTHIQHVHALWGGGTERTELYRKRGLNLE